MRSLEPIHDMDGGHLEGLSWTHSVYPAYSLLSDFLPNFPSPNTLPI